MDTRGQKRAGGVPDPLLIDEVQPKRLKIGQPTLYELPITAPTNGDVIVSTGGTSTAWQPAAPTFDQSLNTTDDVFFNRVDSGSVVSGTTIEGGAIVGETLTVGIPTAYVLPEGGPTAGDVIVSNGGIDTEWKANAGFDQSLNTTDSVVFNQLSAQTVRFESGVGATQWTLVQVGDNLLLKDKNGDTVATFFAGPSKSTTVVGNITANDFRVKNPTDSTLFKVSYYTLANLGTYTINASDTWQSLRPVLFDGYQDLPADHLKVGSVVQLYCTGKFDGPGGPSELVDFEARWGITTPIGLTSLSFMPGEIFELELTLTVIDRADDPPATSTVNIFARQWFYENGTNRSLRHYENFVRSGVDLSIQTIFHPRVEWSGMAMNGQLNMQSYLVHIS